MSDILSAERIAHIVKYGVRVSQHELIASHEALRVERDAAIAAQEFAEKQLRPMRAEADSERISAKCEQAFADLARAEHDSIKIERDDLAGRLEQEQREHNETRGYRQAAEQERDKWIAAKNAETTRFIAVCGNLDDAQKSLVELQTEHQLSLEREILRTNHFAETINAANARATALEKERDRFQWALELAIGDHNSADWDKVLEIANVQTERDAVAKEHYAEVISYQRELNAATLRADTAEKDRNRLRATLESIANHGTTDGRVMRLAQEALKEKK